ncbi:ribosome-associated protein YbcJ [Escherichia coli]
MATFSLGKHPHVELRVAETGRLEQSSTQAKIAIAEGQVKVDGAVETRKRCKIVAGQTVSFAGHSVQVVPIPFPRPVSTGRFFSSFALYARSSMLIASQILPKRPSCQPLLRMPPFPYALV